MIRTAVTALGACYIVSSTSAAAQEMQTVRADGPAAWGDDVRVVEEVRIGSLDGLAEYTLGMVGGVAQLADGTVWVGDRHLHAVRRFSAEGEFIGQLGRDGQGPGEFRYPRSIRQLPDGRVAIWDDGLRRVSLFSPEGEFLDSFTPRTIMMGLPAEVFEVDRSGNLYLIARKFADRSQVEPDTPEGMRALLGIGTPYFWLELRPDGEVQDSIYLEPFDQGSYADPHFTFTALSPAGYRAVARNDEYAVELHTSEARVLRIERSWEPIAYERAERAEKQRLAEAMARRSGSGRPAGRVPDHKPSFSALYVDADGRIWVRLHQPGYRVPEDEAQRAAREEGCRFFGVPREQCDERIREWHEPLVYDVIDPSGRYLGRLRFPDRDTEVEHAQGRTVWVVEKGELDEPYVVRYRIDSPG